MPLPSLSERWHAARRAVIKRAPLPLLTNSHEVALAGALAVIGVALVLQEARPNSVTSQVPHWMVLTWAWSVLLGGLTTIYGVFARRMRWEWAGQIATGHGCGFYALAVATSVSFRVGGVIVVVFLMLSIVSHWRAFKITMMPYVQERLARESTRAILRGGK